MTFLLEVSEHTYKLTIEHENEHILPFLFYLVSACIFPILSKSLRYGWMTCIEDDDKLHYTDWSLAIYVYHIIALDKTSTSEGQIL